MRTFSTLAQVLMAESVQCSVFLMRMVKLHTAFICGNKHVRLSTRFPLHAVKNTRFSCPSHTWSVVLVHSDSGGLQHSHFIHLVHSESNPFPLFMRNLMRRMHNYYRIQVFEYKLNTIMIITLNKASDSQTFIQWCYIFYQLHIHKTKQNRIKLHNMF